jgi:hypothetical protein
MKQYVFFFLVTLSLIGCTEEANPDFEDIPVVQAYLRAGTVLNVKVSRQVPFDTDAVFSAEDLDALQLVVSFDDTSVVLIPQGNGIYAAPDSLLVESGKQYNLAFSFNGKVVEATTVIPSKPVGFTASANSIEIARMDSMVMGPPEFPDPILLTWENPDASYYLVLVENIENTLDPITDFGDNEPPSFEFRKEPVTLDSSELNSREFQYFGTHRIVLYHLNVDYATLYDDAGTSSQNLTNPSTGIQNGYGIFTGVNTDTFLLEVIEQ